MPKFSIIIPVYNAQKTLRKCLESLKCQTERDFQALMVENGSSDGSNAICREFAGADERFVLVQLPVNCGPSGARNAGLDRAEGEWVAFVDSDDHVEPDFLESLVGKFRDTGADVLFFGYRQYSTDGAFLGEHIPPDVDSDGPVLWTRLHRQDLFGYTWIKAFRREIIAEQRFSEKLNLLEDEVFTCEVLFRGCRCAVLDKPLYNYITGNTGSLMGRTHPDYCIKVDAAYRVWKKLLTDWPGAEEYLAELANGHVTRCRYYGFERDVPAQQFYSELARTEFFRDCALQDRFCSLVRSEAIARLRVMRGMYRIKQLAARMLKK
ncbi:MAG: glycosyltransferase family 2 protein [Oscillospiraceae bacterium]|nr:glycosyltransferase family 2 protein [Oscillospiraceae bacterium]